MSEAVQDNNHGLVQITPKMVRDNPFFYLSQGSKDIVIEAHAQDKVFYYNCWFSGIMNQADSNEFIVTIDAYNQMPLSDKDECNTYLMDDNSRNTLFLSEDSEWYSQYKIKTGSLSPDLKEMLSEGGFTLESESGHDLSGRFDEFNYYQKTFIVWGQPLPTAPC